MPTKNYVLVNGLGDAKSLAKINPMLSSTTASGATSPTAGGGKRACTIVGDANLGNSSATLKRVSE